MAPDHRDTQSLEAAQAPTRNHGGLTAAGAQRHRPAPSQALPLAGSLTASTDLRDSPVDKRHFRRRTMRAANFHARRRSGEHTRGGGHDLVLRHVAQVLADVPAMTERIV